MAAVGLEQRVNRAVRNFSSRVGSQSESSRATRDAQALVGVHDQFG